jgi:hypothetical protein
VLRAHQYKFQEMLITQLTKSVIAHAEAKTKELVLKKQR